VKAMAAEVLHMENEKGPNFWKQRFLVGWVILCFICTLICALVVSAVILTTGIFNREKKLEPMCSMLELAPNQIKDRCLLTNQEEKELEKLRLINVISVNNNITTLIMPCSSKVKDDMDNVYYLEGPHILDCQEPRDFMYLSGDISVWHDDHCTSYPDVASGFDLTGGRDTWDNKEIVVGGKDGRDKEYCFGQNNYY
jgi:hypothetical protein